MPPHWHSTYPPTADHRWQSRRGPRQASRSMTATKAAATALGSIPEALDQVPQQRTIQSLLLRWRQVRPKLRHRRHRADQPTPYRPAPIPPRRLDNSTRDTQTHQPDARACPQRRLTDPRFALNDESGLPMWQRVQKITNGPAVGPPTNHLLRHNDPSRDQAATPAIVPATSRQRLRLFAPDTHTVPPPFARRKSDPWLPSEGSVG